MFGKVPGYEETVAGGAGKYLPPPVSSKPMPVPKQASYERNWNIPSISEERANEAFKKYVSNKWNYRSGPVKEGVKTNMESFTTYRYRLETFTESRSVEWSQEPYTGQPMDAGVQRAPRPWQIRAQPTAFFQDQKKKIKVPFTSSIKECHVCLGMGKKPCTTCAGAGNKVCYMCNATGLYQNDKECSRCSGYGRYNCSSCSGNGSSQCDTCRGRRQLLVFINLNVKWSTEKEDFVAQDLKGLKVEKLTTVSGKELCNDSQFMVYPVMDFPDVSVARASERIVRDHQTKLTQTSRILQQRQTIEMIPITKVSYTWKGKPCVYYVYGNELKVNVDNYPATYCPVM